MRGFQTPKDRQRRDGREHKIVVKIKVLSSAFVKTKIIQ